MAKRPNTLKQPHDEESSEERRPRRVESLKALRRLREFGEKLPVVDAAEVVRQSRDLAEQGVR